MHVALRIGDDDPRLLELVPDAQEHLALDIAEPAFGIGDPDPQLMVHAALAEFGDPANRRGRLEHAGRFGRGVEHQLLRSEEHTSELQSLMRISYAVFCLKKKTIQTRNHEL